MIYVTSVDAGGAEILSCWIKHLKIKEKIIYCLKGPAISIFKKNIGSFENLNEKDINKIKIKKIITGTSWDSDIEKKIIPFLVNSSLKVVATETESKTASTAIPFNLFCSTKGIPSFL